MSWQNFVNFLL